MRLEEKIEKYLNEADNNKFIKEIVGDVKKLYGKNATEQQVQNVILVKFNLIQSNKQEIKDLRNKITVYYSSNDPQYKKMKKKIKSNIDEVIDEVMAKLS